MLKGFGPHDRVSGEAGGEGAVAGEGGFLSGLIAHREEDDVMQRAAIGEHAPDADGDGIRSFRKGFDAVDDGLSVFERGIERGEEGGGGIAAGKDEGGGRLLRCPRGDGGKHMRAGSAQHVEVHSQSPFHEVT